MVIEARAPRDRGVNESERFNGDETLEFGGTRCLAAIPSLVGCGVVGGEIDDMVKVDSDDADDEVADGVVSYTAVVVVVLGCTISLASAA